MNSKSKSMNSKSKTMKNIVIDKSDSYHTFLDFIIEPANINKKDIEKLNYILHDDE